MLGTIISEAEKVGLNAWLYDDDPFNLAADLSSFLKAGKNKVRIEWYSAGEFDGLKSSVYLKGTSKNWHMARDRRLWIDG